MPDVDDQLPPGPVTTTMRALHGTAGTVLEASLAGSASQLGTVLQLDRDLAEWERALAARPETSLLSDARRHLGWSIFAAATGFYGLAYGALRVALELSFAAVDFSANELLRRRWLQDRADFSWSAALDRENGLLSPSFVQEFNEGAVHDARSFAQDAAECYRLCSQFMHGKRSATSQVPAVLAYSSDTLHDWISTAVTAKKSVLFLLYIRYGHELLPGSDGNLAATLESSLGHLRSVRTDLGLPIEE